MLIVYDIESYREVSGRQSCALMSKTLVEMIKNNNKTVIRYDVYDLGKYSDGKLAEHLRKEVGLKYTSKRMF